MFLLATFSMNATDAVLEALECSAARQAFAVALGRVNCLSTKARVDSTCTVSLGVTPAALELTTRCTWWTSRAALDGLERCLR